MLLGLRVAATDGFRAERPIQAGSRYARPEVLLPGQPVRAGDGYDGQFYFYLAQDPVLRRAATAASLDNTFRVRRILYPLLAWALSLGRRTALPWVLLLLNMAASATTVGLAAWAAARRGRSAWWALALAAYAGVWIPVLLDLTEPLQLSLLAAGMLAGSAPLLFLAALAKETAAVALVTEAVRRRSVVHAGLALLYVAWALFVFLFVKGTVFNDLGAHFLDPPAAPFRLLFTQGPVHALVLGPAIFVCLVAIGRLFTARDGATWAAAAYAALALGAGNDTWLDPTAFYRVTAGALLLTYLSWCVRGDRWALSALLVGAFSGALALPALLAA
ncbi:MAG TPA: hypothetical protein VF160_06735 [Candidatus Dormibacteraeota bacterium]